MNSDGLSACESASEDSATPPLKCPNCGGPLYSQRSRLCGQCGAGLPPEMVLTDEEAAALHAQRQWARDLADKFDTTGRAVKQSPPTSARARYEGAAAAPDELIRPHSCAAEFKHRKRPWFWLVFVGDAFILWALAALLEVSKLRLSWREWLCVLAFTAFSNFLLWLRAWPVCPNCKQNIRSCPPEFCLACGRRLSHRRCTDCGVDHSWTGWFFSYRNGAFRWIKHCPGCGVELNSCVRRWQARGL